MNLLTELDLEALLQSPFFAALLPVLSRLHGSGFPSLADCNALLTQCRPSIEVRSGMPLRFVAQESGKLPFEAQYEPRCYLRGEVQLREQNWHDLFNALVWMAFPGAKAAINARHYRSMIDAEDGNGNRRGSERDMLTLLDESGVIVACSDVQLDQLLRNFQWEELFWHQRGRVMSGMEFYLLGHGLYEKALRPYIGMTGQGLLLTVDREFFTLPMQQRLRCMDQLIAEYLEAPGHCRTTRELTPVPLLGIPGWWDGNNTPSFYKNVSYFRSQRL